MMMMMMSTILEYNTRPTPPMRRIGQKKGEKGGFGFTGRYR